MPHQDWSNIRVYRGRRLSRLSAEHDMEMVREPYDPFRDGEFLALPSIIGMLTCALIEDSSSFHYFTSREPEESEPPPSPNPGFLPMPSYLSKQGPQLSARRLTLRRDGYGPYVWTIPKLIECAFTSGALIRRFELLQSIDRTHFEGGRKRQPGELSRWPGHGKSKLRISFTVEDLDKDEDEDEDDYDGFYPDGERYYDSDSDGTLVPKHPFFRHLRPLSSEMKDACGWNKGGSHFELASMDIDERLRLF